MTKRKTIKPVKGFARIENNKIKSVHIPETREAIYLYKQDSIIKKGRGFIEALVTPIKKK